MKTITKTVTVYHYDELSEQAKENVLQMLCDINVDYNWWEFVYEDAEQIGLKLTSFDIGRGNDISGHLLWEPSEVKQAILKNHGKTCNTYKYVQSCDLRKENEREGFLYGLLQEYLSILTKEYEYLTSEEVIIETIKANEYEFNKHGEWPF